MRTMILKRAWYFWVVMVVSLVIAVNHWNDYRSTYLSIETTLQNTGTQQIFFDDGEGFREELSNRLFVDTAFKTVRYKIPLPDTAIAQIRLDPSDTDGWVRFSKMVLKCPGNEEVPLLGDHSAQNGILDLRYNAEDEYWSVTPEYGQTDAFFVISYPQNQTEEGEFRRKQVHTILWLLLTVLLISLATELLLRLAFGSHGRTLFKKLVKGMRSRWFKGCFLLVLLCVILWTVMSLFRKENGESSQTHLQFEILGEGIESVQLDYDLGDGFIYGQSRLFWNKTHQSVLNLEFRLPSDSVKRLRLSIEGDPDLIHLTHFKRWEEAQSSAVVMELSDWVPVNASCVAIEAVSPYELRLKRAHAGAFVIQMDSFSTDNGSDLSVDE